MNLRRKLSILDPIARGIANEFYTRFPTNRRNPKPIEPIRLGPEAHPARFETAELAHSWTTRNALIGRLRMPGPVPGIVGRNELAVSGGGNPRGEAVPN